MLRKFSLVAFIALSAITLHAASHAEQSRPSFQSEQPAAFTGRLSVLTYNVHGLPWPVALGRDQDFARIVDKLSALRRHGDSPDVVVLQEAFTQNAQAIGREAGYRYVVNGPSDAFVSHQSPNAGDRRFASEGSWLKGEGLPKFVGSGLQILSDYPIVDVRDMVFPDFACAGYDCLANKGALLARIQLPGQARPVDIITLHLNSRRASGVSTIRANRAYQFQVSSLAAFIRANHDSRNALIVAGDFNMGGDRDRIAELNGSYPRWVSHEPISDVYNTAALEHIPLSPDARFSRWKARDRLFFAPGEDIALALRRIEVPFGRSADGSMLSDHVGYAAVFSVRRETDGITTALRSTSSACGGAKACIAGRA